MQPNTYKFYINSTEVYPHYKSLIKKYEKENNQLFFREKLEGEIKLFGADYLLVKNSSLYQEHTFLIQKETNGSYEDYFIGTFTKADCEFDLDKRMCKLSLSPKDLYSAIMDNYDNEYNLVDLAPALTPVTISKRPILQVYVLEDTIINNFLPNGVTWETTVDADVDLIDLYEKSFFELQGNQLEIRISGGLEFDGVYTAQGWTGSILTSPTNPDYVIYGAVNMVSGDYDYAFTIVHKDDTATPLYSASEHTETRFTTATFLGASAETAGKIFNAEVSMETVLARILTGFSVTHDGRVALGKLAEGDFGYTAGYSYVYSALGMISTVVSPATSREPTPYGKADNGLYFTAPYAPYGRYYPFAKSTWAYSSRWAYLNGAFEVFDIAGSVYSSINDCIHIADVIKALLKKLAPNIAHEATTEYSQFLYGTSNPIYGEKFELFITQKTHVKKFIYDTPATKVPITFEKVMNMLAKCFRCYWYIEDGKFKVEHLSFFENGKSYSPSEQVVGIDTTVLYDNKNGRPIGYGQDVIKYDKNSLPSRFEFSYMDKSSIEFEGPAVKLAAPYLQQDKTESINAEDFSADLDMIISNTISISDDGFALLAAKKSVADDLEYYSTFKYSLELINEQGATYTVSLQNGVLSWMYLFNFYITSLPTTVAEYDGFPKKTINVEGLTKCMKQEIKIPVTSDPSLYTLIATNIGNGQVNSMSIDLTTRQATIELLYTPE